MKAPLAFLSSSLALCALVSIGLTHGALSKPTVAAGARVEFEEALGMDVVPGAFVVDTRPDGAGETAGIGRCDLIAGFDGRSVRSEGGLQLLLKALRERLASTAIVLDVWKWRESEDGLGRDRSEARIPSGKDGLGVSVTFQVLIAGVAERGAAAVSGVAAGELIEAVDGKSVTDLQGLADLDKMMTEILDREGKVTLTLSRWRPLDGVPGQLTLYTTRDVDLTAP